jgi:uracil phosphoribosyltransferase
MKFKNLRILDHPLIQQKLCYLRDRNTESSDFRRLLDEISALMVYEVTRNLPLQAKQIETPLEKTTGYVLARPLTLVPILRAGIVMGAGMLNLIPRARTGYLGIYRNEETFQPVEYYRKFPVEIAPTEIIIIDPMLATGGTAAAAIDYVKKKGGRTISFVCVVAAPEGVRFLEDRHPEVPVYAAALDRELNERAYILPGLGDAGDRIYGTE